MAGLVERVTNFNPESGFPVLRVEVQGQPGPVTVLGSLPSASTGMNPRHRIDLQRFMYRAWDDLRANFFALCLCDIYRIPHNEISVLHALPFAVEGTYPTFLRD